MTLRKWVSTAWVVGRERKSYHSAWSRVHGGENARQSPGTRWDAVESFCPLRRESLQNAATIRPCYCLQASGTGCRRGSRSSARSEEHTSELQSHLNLVCRLLLEKK